MATVGCLSRDYCRTCKRDSLFVKNVCKHCDTPLSTAPVRAWIPHTGGRRAMHVPRLNDAQKGKRKKA